MDSNEVHILFILERKNYPWDGWRALGYGLIAALNHGTYLCSQTRTPCIYATRALTSTQTLININRYTILRQVLQLVELLNFSEGDSVLWGTTKDYRGLHTFKTSFCLHITLYLPFPYLLLSFRLVYNYNFTDFAVFF